MNQPSGHFAFNLTVLLLGAIALVAVSCGTESAGVAEDAQLGNFVWIDANGDGIQEADEQGLANVKVNLLDAQGNVIDSKTTDLQGLYAFLGLDSDDYILEFQPPESEYKFTLPNQGGNDALDSDADQESGRTDSFAYDSERGSNDHDAGLILEPTATVPPPPAATPTPTPEPQITTGEVQVEARIFEGEGDCMANPADFTIFLIVRVRDDGTMEIEQPPLHLNVGTIDPDGTFKVTTGEGADTETYMGKLDREFNGAGTYFYRTASGECTYKFVITVIPT